MVKSRQEYAYVIYEGPKAFPLTSEIRGGSILVTAEIQRLLSFQKWTNKNYQVTLN